MSTKRVLKAISVMGGMQVATVLCSVVRTKLIALWIGPVGVGLFAIFNSVVDMVANATQLNFRQSAVRDVAQSPQARLPHIAAVVRWWALRLGLFGATVMLVGAPLWSYLSFGDLSWWWAFTVLAIVVAMLAVGNGEQTILQGTSDLRRLARAVVVGVVIGTAVSIPMYYMWGVGSIIPSLVVFAVAQTACLVAVRPVKSADVDRRRAIAEGRPFITLGLYFTVSGLVTTGAMYAFLSYLNQTASTETAGIYQAGYTLVVKYAGLIFTAIGLEFYPRVSQIVKRPRMTSTVVSHEVLIVLAVLTPISMLFALLAPVAIDLLYTAQFMAALPMVIYGIGGILFRAVSFCLAFIIVARGDGRTYVATEVSSALIGLTLNIVGYRLYGYTGLGVSYLLWYVVYAAMVWAVYRYRYGMRLRRPAILATAASALLIALAIAASACIYL